MRVTIKEWDNPVEEIPLADVVALATGDNVRLELGAYDDYGSSCPAMKLTRAATDAEIKADREAQEKRAKLQAIANQEAERIQYARLKAKFEGKP